MLVIRQEQMEVFRRAALRDYLNWVVYRLRGEFEAEVGHLSDPDLEDFIWKATDTANRFGITLQPDAARFVEYAACFGLDFGSVSALPGAQQILRRSDVDGHAKIALLDALEGALPPVD
jgi:hypothetical protein